MLKIYIARSCHSCERAIQWAKKQGLSFKVIDLITDRITKKDLTTLLSLTDGGVEEIISKRSNAYQNLNINFETTSINELLTLVLQNRTLLRRPLITDNSKLQVGYNEDDIRKFLPKKIRKISLDMAIENIKREEFRIEKVN